MKGIDAGSLDSGDVVWIDFGDIVGHEQAGRRPGMIVSPQPYNRGSSVLLACPITRNDRYWPFKVRLTGVAGLTGFVLADQVRSIDPEDRIVRVAGRASSETIAEVRAKLVPIICYENR